MRLNEVLDVEPQKVAALLYLRVSLSGASPDFKIRTKALPSVPNSMDFNPVVENLVSTIRRSSVAVAVGSPTATTNQGMEPETHSAGLRVGRVVDVDNRLSTSSLTLAHITTPVGVLIPVLGS